MGHFLFANGYRICCILTSFIKGTWYGMVWYGMLGHNTLRRRQTDKKYDGTSRPLAEVRWGVAFYQTSTLSALVLPQMVHVSPLVGRVNEVG